KTLPGLGLRLREGREELAAEPAAATTALRARRRARPSAEIEELRRGGRGNADQHRNGDRQHDQGAAFGQHAVKWFSLSHPARSQRDSGLAAIIAERGRKRGDLSP